MTGTGARDRKGREGRWKAGPEKGLSQEPRDMWRAATLGAQPRGGPFRADGVPRTVILRERPRTGEAWLESGRRELPSFTEHLLLFKAYPGMNQTFPKEGTF